MWELRAISNHFTLKSFLIVTTKFFENANSGCQITRNSIFFRSKIRPLNPYFLETPKPYEGGSALLVATFVSSCHDSIIIGHFINEF